MEKLDKYFERCIEDAFKAEEREYKPEKIKWFYIIVDSQILFSISTPYARVTRRAEYRINNNVTKNFGFDTDGNYFLDTTFQPNFVCNKFKVGNRNWYLCEKMDYNKMEQGEVIPSGRYERLCKAYHRVTTEEYREKYNELHLPSDISWNDYRNTYLNAYGKYPEVKINDKSKTVEDQMK